MDFKFFTFKCCLQHVKYYVLFLYVPSNITIPVFEAFMETLVELVPNCKHILIVGVLGMHLMIWRMLNVIFCSHFLNLLIINSITLSLILTSAFSTLSCHMLYTVFPDPYALIGEDS